jgi:hypothetical protein
MSTFLPIEKWGDITTSEGLKNAVAAFVSARRTPTDPRHTEAENAAGLTIPPSANADWVVPPISPEDRYQIIDLRAGTTFLNVPLSQRPPSQSAGYPFAATAVVGTVTEHQPAATAGEPAAGVALQRVVHGGSSTSCLLLRPVTETARRWYPAAMEGISPGLPLHVTRPGDNKTYGVVVADIGWDSAPPPPDTDPDRPPQPLPYFTVADHSPDGFPSPPLPLPKTTRIERKTAIGALQVIEEDHTLNQMSALKVTKYAYSDGDASCGEFRLNYQGDFFSAGGDEGGLGATADLTQDLKLFSGTVEDFAFKGVDSENDPNRAWVLTYQEQPHLNVERLATGRPIINLSRNWIEGMCRVWNSTTYPNRTQCH